MWFGTVLLQNAGTSLETTVSGCQHTLFYMSFCINKALTDVHVPHAMGTDTPPYQDRCWILDPTLITAWMVLFMLGPKGTVAVLPKKYVKHTSTVLLSISDEAKA